MSNYEPGCRKFVLLTGATGLVGGLVLANLLQNEQPVAVLVRGNRRRTALERAEILMRRLEERFGRLFSRPVVLSGDLNSPELGLAPSDRDWVAANCNSIIHSGANLLFRPAKDHPDNEPFRTNVTGTKCLHELAKAAGIREWHYVSTAYIAGLRSGRIYERDCEVGQQFGNDYERSKVQAEQFLRQSPYIDQLTVYRPSIVIDLHPTTSMRSDQTINSAFVMFQALSQRFGLPKRGDWFRRLGFDGSEKKNIVTVDWVSSMISQIYRRPALHGQTYHLTSPNGTSASDLEDSFSAAVQMSGIKLPATRSEALPQIDEQAAPFVAAFQPYFKDDPVFDRENLLRAVRECGESDVPTLTVEALRDFCMRQTKPVLPPSAIEESVSDWGLFVSNRHLIASNEMLSANNQIATGNFVPDASVFGLETFGPGGGQWLISEKGSRVLVRQAAVSEARIRWICRAVTLNEIIAGGLTVSRAIEAGLLFIESETVMDAEGTSVATDGFCRLVAAVRLMNSVSAVRNSEVANVR